MAVTEDAATVLEQFIHDVANLPAEIAHLYEEANAKQQLINECNATIATHDGNLQKQIKAHGTQNPHPKEPLLVKAVRDAYARAAQLQDEKIALMAKASGQLDRYVRRLDVKIRDLQADGAMPLDGAMPTLLRASAIGNLVPADPTMAASQAGSGASTPLQALSGNAGHGGPGASFPAAALSRLAQHAAAAARPGGGAASAGANGVGGSNKTGTASPAHPDSLKRRRTHAPSSLAGGVAAAQATRHASLGPGTSRPSTPGGAGSGRAGSVPRTTGGAGAGALKKAGGGVGGSGVKKVGGASTPLSVAAAVSAARKKAAAAVAAAANGGAAAGAGLKGTPGTASAARKSASAASAAARRGSPAVAAGAAAAAAAAGAGAAPSGTPDEASEDEDDVDGDDEGDDDESLLSSGPEASGSEVGSRVGARRAASNASGTVAARRAPPGATGGAGGAAGGTASGLASANGSGKNAGKISAADGAPGNKPRATGPTGDAKKKMAGTTTWTSSTTNSTNTTTTTAGAGMELDEAADDTKYCYCQDVSHGDMIACDNADCRVQWFHWTCAGITAEPTGEWLCRDCRRLPRERIRKQ